MRLLITVLLSLACLGHASDQIVLKSGMTLKGEVTHYHDGKITIRLADGRSTTGALDKIAEIRFEGAPAEAPPALKEPTAKKVKTFRSLREVFLGLPSDLHPHTARWRTNPLLGDRLREWFAANRIGSRLVLRNRDLLAIENSLHSLSVSDEPFLLGGSKYRTSRGITCTYWSRRTFKRTEFNEFQDALKAKGLTYAGFKEHELLGLKKVARALSNFAVPTSDVQGRITGRSSRVNVIGTIASPSTQPVDTQVRSPRQENSPPTWGDIPVRNAEPPHVLAHITLSDVTITK